MTNITRYNAKDCVVTVGGVQITGLGEDMVTFSKEEAYIETSVGAQGDVVANEVNNDIWTLAITVQATSPQLPYLLSLQNKKDFFPAYVNNKALKMRFGGSKAKITEAPEISLGAQAEDMEISFQVFDGKVDNI